MNITDLEDCATLASALGVELSLHVLGVKVRKVNRFNGKAHEEVVTYRELEESRDGRNHLCFVIENVVHKLATS